ncbi:MAG: NAD-dependent epimerase/dehydratase family protein, partial [Promethearchaeota archaeon]
MIKNKNILLTGGAGFIGSHLLERLIDNSNFVLVIDNFSSLESEKNF